MMCSFLKNAFIIVACAIVFWSCTKAKSSVNPDAGIVQDTVLVEPEIVEIAKDYLLGHIDFKQDTQFALIPSNYTNRQGIYLHKETLEAYIEMASAAAEENISLKINSAARNFNYQKGIWQRKWKKYEAEGLQGIEIARKILLYSSMPGTSRHHWGTEVDLNSFNNKHFKSGQGLKTYEWLRDNASKYGFCQTYTAMDSLRNTGYQEERWHWSYIPLAERYTKSYVKHVTYRDITGCIGSEYAEEMRMIPDFVLGIHPRCRG